MSDKIIIEKNEFETLVAITEDEHIQGLMYKSWPPPIMTFAFNNLDVRKFWMMNTPSPLDIIFCRNNKVVAICEGKPLSLDLVGPDEPIDMVVEMPRGYADRFNIKINSMVDIKYTINSLSKKFVEGI